MKLTKIVATVGPACDSNERVEKLIRIGVDVFRFNLKHNTLDWHAKRIDRVNRISRRIHKSVAILIDLQGPEVRLHLPVESYQLKKGDRLVLLKRLTKISRSISFSHTEVMSQLKDRQTIFVDDGKLQFTVSINKGRILLISYKEGILYNNKSVSIPNIRIDSTLQKKDIKALKLCKNHQVDYVALSYVRGLKDLLVLRREMRKINCQSHIVSKIETRPAIENLDDIISNSDAVMVARGDLGVEFPIEHVPFYQKRIIRRCIELTKPVITATEMLYSMINSSVPTRAEVSDIANATYDFTDALMLSGETATGLYPVEAVQVMKKTVIFNEQKQTIDTRALFNLTTSEQEGLISNAAYDLFLKIRSLRQNLRGFIVYTKTGTTARMLSRYKPTLPIFAFCESAQVARLLSVYFGIYPIIMERRDANGVVFSERYSRKDIDSLLKQKLIKRGDRMIMLHAVHWSDNDNISAVELITCV